MHLRQGVQSIAWALAVCFIFPTAVLCAADTADSVEKAIFDGKTLEGWEGNKDSWRVEDGAITGEILDGKSLGRNEFIFFKDEMHDFEFSTEFRISGGPSANSGIQFRSAKAEHGEAAGYQADLDDGAVWLGRIYDENGRGMIVERGTRVSIAPDGRRWIDTFAKPESFKTLPKPKGEWNTYSIIAFASHTEVRVNGVLCSVLDDHQSGGNPANSAEWSGRIAFQLHAGPGPAKIQFRNVKLKHTGKTELPARAAVAKVEKPAEPSPADAGNPPIKAVGADGKALNLDFETGTLADWKVEGDAWAGQPIKGDTVKPRKPGEESQHKGEYWIGGYEKAGDGGTGTLTSPQFDVKHGWASFLIGGGRANTTRFEIVEAEGGKVFATFSGDDRETMRREAVDLNKLMGKRIFLRLVDENNGGWGHINFDELVFHAKAPAKVAAAPTRAAGTGGRLSDSGVLWHLRPNPAKPSTAGNDSGKKVIAGMMLQDGFQAELLATEPDVVQPIAFAIDERGRLWIAEALSYPNRRPDAKAEDRIVILSDEDGDGVFETRKVFVEKLNLISGLEVGFGGVWVGAPPYLMFIPDRDGDDKPDGAAEILLDGWGYQDTHETLNSFTWGPDGWLYGNQGVFTRSLVGKPGATNEQRQEIRAGIWRYHPIRKEFEIFAHGGSNQWGLDFNDRGHLFMTHCRSFFGGGGTTYVVRNGHYWNQANAGYAPFISSKTPPGLPDLKNYLMSSAKYDSGEGGAGKPGTTAVYGGHSHVGTMIYLGDNWPAIYRNHVFTNNLFGQQTNHQHNVREGSGYETLHAGYDILHAPDPSYLALDLQCGPDGAVYAIDWTDLQHCHTPQDEKWDRSNGRVFRVEWAATYKPVKVNLGAQNDSELVALLNHRNAWYGRTAQKLLQARAAAGKLDEKVFPALKEMFAKAADEPAALRALWALHVTGGLDEALIATTQSSAFEAVRAWTVQLSTEKLPVAATRVEALAKLAREDVSPLVRLAVASALPVLPEDARWPIVSALAAKSEDARDRWLPKMIWSGVASQSTKDPKRALALATATPMPTLSNSLRWYLARTPAGREELAQSIANETDEAALVSLRLLATGLSDMGGSASMPAAWPAASKRFLTGNNAELRDVTEQLSMAFGDKVIYAKMVSVLGDEKAPIQERRRAFNLVKNAPDAAALAVFMQLLKLPEFISEVIPLLSRSEDPAVSAALMEQFSKFNATDRSAVLGTLTSRPVHATALLKAVQEKKFERKDLNSLHIRQMKNLKDDGVTKLLEQVWGTVGDTSANAKTAIANFKKKFSDAPLWAFSAESGQKTFQQKICATCHMIGNIGVKIGPDLSGSFRNGVDYFIENIVDPNAVVGEDFQMHVIAKNDGQVVSGLLQGETDAAITIRTATETVSIRKDEIKKRHKTVQSLMPEGLLDTLPEREAIELLKFLTTKK